MHYVPWLAVDQNTILLSGINTTFLCRGCVEESQNRDRSNQWLCQAAEGSGVKVLYGARFSEFHRSGMIKVMVKEKESITELKSRYLIGAGGVFSKVRRQLYPNLEWKTLRILQEY